MVKANNRMQSDFGELTLASAADAKRYALVMPSMNEEKHG